MTRNSNLARLRDNLKAARHAWQRADERAERTRNAAARRKAKRVADRAFKHYAELADVFINEAVCITALVCDQPGGFDVVFKHVAPLEPIADRPLRPV